MVIHNHRTRAMVATGAVQWIGAAMLSQVVLRQFIDGAPEMPEELKRAARNEGYEGLENELSRQYGVVL